MSSKLAKRILAMYGLHTGIEKSNFSAGTGNKKFSLPYQVIEVTDRTGDSKRTVGHAVTLADAREIISAQQSKLSARGGADYLTYDRVAYYIRDIRTDKILR